MKIQNPFAPLPYFWSFLKILLLVTIFSFTACDSGPRVINAETDGIEVEEADRPIFKSVAVDLKLDPSTTVKNNAVAHEVIVEEVLNTEKYAYLKVKEEADEFWIAISKRDIKVGDTYVYKGGLLKRNFFSREFNRVFDTVYLVSNIRKKAQPKTSELPKTEPAPTTPSLPDLNIEKVALAEGAISLFQLFDQKSKYAGQKIKITGKCMKVNPKIMNRNWIHIQDGSGEQLDLTVTTAESIPLGAIVSLEGIITLDKDFGAGYRYDIIMEEAVLK